jgi:hypothetical protein
LDAYGKPVVKMHEPVSAVGENKATLEDPRSEMLKLGNNLVYLTD